LCEGRVYNHQFNNAWNSTRATRSYFNDKVPLVDKDVAFPCGYMAASFPGDRFKELKDENGKTFPIFVDQKLNMDGTEADKWIDGDTDEFKNKQWTSVQDPLFRNWMVSKPIF
jgi:hypothetical protein